MCAVPNVAAFYNSKKFFPDIILSHCPKGFEMVAVASINTGMTLVFKFHIIIIIIIIIITITITNPIIIIIVIIVIIIIIVTLLLWF
jgi:hypothetical protein